MRKIHVKLTAIALIMSIMIAQVLTAGTFAAGESEEKYDTYDTQGDDTYISMDEDGNVTLIPMDEVELPDSEALSEIDNVYYEIIVSVEGEDNVVNVVETEEAAVEEVETIQTIIDEQDTTEAAIEEIAIITESEALAEMVDMPVADPLEIEVNTDATSSSARNTSTLEFSVSAESASTKSAASDKAITVTSQKVTYEVTYGVVEFKYSTDTYEFTDVNSGAYRPYIYEGMAPDAAYLGTTSDGQVMFMQSGVVGLIDASYVNIYEYDTFTSSGYITNYYYTKNGVLYHAITTNMTSVASTQVFGYQQDYMTDNTNYYSYDGHYFYTDYKTMITDYMNNTYDNAINADEPYYNYYLYLSHRTTTEFTADQIDEYIDYRINLSSTDSVTSSSALADIGSILIENQDTYGVNALLMLGVAINESAWGMSSYAQNRNNLFGHKAYDSDPSSADIYSSVAEGVMYHARNFISYGYLDAEGDSRYNGSHLGNKQSGINVRYASDSYWGEKAAANCWLIEMYYSDGTENIDAFSETMGIVNNSASIYESPGGSVLYELKNYKMDTSWEIPVVILDEVTYNGVLWYKIQSDMGLTDDRSDVYCYDIYDFDTDYAYIKASDVYVVYEGTDDPDSYILGDPSGDGKISAIDYMIVKNYIMGSYSLTGDNWLAADVNKDNKISAIDYMMIKNHIMGTSLIE